MNKSPHLRLAQDYWTHHLPSKSFVIDATCGNGHDTLFLVQHFEDGLLIGLDIQSQAIENTTNLLRQSIPESHLSRIQLYQMSHENIDSLKLSKDPQLIVFNLGYLPGGDKKITTQMDSTLISLQKCTHLLANDGAISITCYPGHAEGKKEEGAILRWAENLSPSDWQICHHRWINRPLSPSLFWIQKKGIPRLLNP